MLKRSSIPAATHGEPAADLLHATQVMQEVVGTLYPSQALAVARGKNPAAVALGRRGGLKGGKARALSLTKARRAEIARKAAEARWNSKSA
jgi:hypothetical protein